MSLSLLEKQMTGLNAAAEALRECGSLLLANGRMTIEIEQLKEKPPLQPFKDMFELVGKKLETVSRSTISIQDLHEMARILQADPRRSVERNAEIIAQEIDPRYKELRTPVASAGKRQPVWGPWP